MYEIGVKKNVKLNKKTIIIKNVLFILYTEDLNVYPIHVTSCAAHKIACV